jgi:predicted chitinase
MRAKEFIIERNRKKRRLRGAAYGPGPMGMYGTMSGYSGDGGSSMGEGWKESEEIKLPIDSGSYSVENTNDGVLIYAEGVQMGDAKIWVTFIYNLTSNKTVEVSTDDDYNGTVDVDNSDIAELIDDVVSHVKRYYGSTWDEISDELHGGLSVQEDWKDWVGGAAIGAAVATGGPAAYDAYKAKQTEKEPAVAVAKADDRNNFKKGLDQIAKDAVPKKSVTGSPHEKFLTQSAIAAGITGEELAQFLAQTAHESHNFKSMVEYGGSLDFRKYDPKYAPRKAKELGNKKVGDGARYKGRGYIQLTGRYNYKRAGEALGLPLEQKPELVEKPEVAAKVAVWFWQNRVQPRVDNFGDTRASTKPINSGLKGLQDRKDKFQDFKAVMK